MRPRATLRPVPEYILEKKFPASNDTITKGLYTRATQLVQSNKLTPAAFKETYKHLKLELERKRQDLARTRR